MFFNSVHCLGYIAGCKSWLYFINEKEAPCNVVVSIKQMSYPQGFAKYHTRGMQSFTPLHLTEEKMDSFVLIKNHVFDNFYKFNIDSKLFMILQILYSDIIL